VLFSPRKRGSIFYQRWFVCLSVCSSVTTITKRIVDEFVPNFMGRFLEEKGRPSSCFITIGRGMWKQRSKNTVNQWLFTFYTSNSRCGKCCQVWATKTPRILLSWGVLLSQSTFHLVLIIVILWLHWTWYRRTVCKTEFSLQQMLNSYNSVFLPVVHAGSTFGFAMLML